MRLPVHMTVCSKLENKVDYSPLTHGTDDTYQVTGIQMTCSLITEQEYY
jgi:hypothetical protein